MFSLKNKVVIVIGGNGLIGKALVKGINEQEGTAVVADVAQVSGGFIADICSKLSLEQLISSVVEKHGKIDGVVNVAYPRSKKFGAHFFDVEYKDFCEDLNLQMGGYFQVTQVFAAHFKKQGFGNIINFSSIYGEVAPRFEIYEGTTMTVSVVYAAVKAGISQLTRYMAKYLKGTNVRINTVTPGGILDNQPASFLANYKAQTLNKGMLDKEDVVGAVVFLLSDASTAINGQNIVVDDGFTL